MELAIAFVDVANINVDMRNLAAASEWQEKALEVAAVCAGTDYETYFEEKVTMGRIQQLRYQQEVRTRTH
ncbi:MAG: hypothetical protein Q9226_000759 [Calogaya cf. arnoldii]